MVTRSRFSTTTVVDLKYLDPWLAAEGHLAYSPTEPPARGYFFQYTWILPGIFNPKIMLSDSVLSFNTVHDRFRRCETGGLRDGTWLGGELAVKAGLYIRSPGFASNVWHAAQQSYSLDPVMGERKFGPHHVVMKTFLSNIRITTFFAGESEEKIVDPSRISEVQGFGCEVEFIPPTKSDLNISC